MVVDWVEKLAVLFLTLCKPFISRTFSMFLLSDFTAIIYVSLWIWSPSKKKTQHKQHTWGNQFCIVYVKLDFSSFSCSFSLKIFEYCHLNDRICIQTSMHDLPAAQYGSNLRFITLIISLQKPYGKYRKCIQRMESYIKWSTWWQNILQSRRSQ